MPNGDRLVTLDELAATLHYRHRDSARRWARQHGVPVLRIGKADRLRLNDVRRALDDLAAKS